MKILLVEDDELIVEIIQKALTNQHYLVDVATDGEAGFELAEVFEYNLIVLDLMLPKLDGISFCRQLRQQGKRTPILLLTAHDTSSNKVMGLDAGADDYVIKPFDLHELLARIRALLRRGSSTITPVMQWGKLALNPSNCKVTYGDQPLNLTPKEYGIVELFLRNTQRIFSQSALLDHLWSYEEPPSENTVRAHIKSLRQKLKKAGAETDLIETVYGLGYRLKSKELEVTSKAVKHTESSPPSLPAKQQPKEAIQETISLDMMAMWERFKSKYSDRVTVIEEAVDHNKKGFLSEQLRQQAIREAHTLVGSLGSFGLLEASRLARELEEEFQVLEEEKLPKQNLSELVAALRLALDQPLVETENLESLPQPTNLKQPSQLLIVDDDTALGLSLISEATAWGFRAEIASDLYSARKFISRSRPDFVLLDLCFPDSTENGFGLLAELASYDPPIPVVVFTARESFADRVKVVRLGGQGFLHKPVSPARVMEAIAQVLQQSITPQAKLMIVDDDPQLLDFLRTLLEPWGFILTLLDDPQHFWDTLEQTVPDLLILDVDMPELSGIDLCQVVRNDLRWADLPVLFLSSRTDVQTIQQVFTVGADDYLNKPIIGPELIARVLNRLERSSYINKSIVKKRIKE